MASVKYEVGSTTTVMSDTELGSLAADANAISSEINNSVNLYLFDDVELHIDEGYGGNFADGSGVDLYLVREELDSTGYEDGDDTIDPPAANLVGVFGNNSDATQVHILRQIPIPACKYKYVVINRTGAYSSSIGANELKIRPYRYQTS